MKNSKQQNAASRQQLRKLSALNAKALLARGLTQHHSIPASSLCNTCLQVPHVRMNVLAYMCVDLGYLQDWFHDIVLGFCLRSITTEVVRFARQIVVAADLFSAATSRSAYCACNLLLTALMKCTASRLVMVLSWAMMTLSKRIDI